jgi:hypothetical protein
MPVMTTRLFMQTFSVAARIHQLERVIAGPGLIEPA